MDGQPENIMHPAPQGGQRHEKITVKCFAVLVIQEKAKA